MYKMKNFAKRIDMTKIDISSLEKTLRKRINIFCTSFSFGSQSEFPSKKIYVTLHGKPVEIKLQEN